MENEFSHINSLIALQRLVFVVRPFEELNRNDKVVFENGGRIIAPHNLLEKALGILGNREVLQFRIHSPRKKIPFMVGVLDFHFEEETYKKNAVYIPTWIQKIIGAKVGETIIMSLVDLPKATHLTIKPLKASFLQISDPKATLDRILPNFSAVIKGQLLRFWDDETNSAYTVKITDVQPAIKEANHAVSLINTDVVLTFEDNWYEKLEGKKATNDEEENNKAASASYLSRDVNGKTVEHLLLKVDDNSPLLKAKTAEPHYLDKEKAVVENGYIVKSSVDEKQQFFEEINFSDEEIGYQYTLSDYQSNKIETEVEKIDEKNRELISKSSMNNYIIKNKDAPNEENGSQLSFLNTSEEMFEKKDVKRHII